MWTLDLTMVTWQSRIFLINGNGSIGFHKNEMTHNSYCAQKINSICIVDLNMKFKAKNFLEDTIEEQLYDLSIAKDFR